MTRGPWYKFLYDLCRYLLVVLRRKTLCRFNFHKYQIRQEQLALGEVLEFKVCSVFQCNHVHPTWHRVTKPYKGDGKFFAWNVVNGQLVDLGDGRGPRRLPKGLR